MKNEAQREISLDEYLGQLPPSHRARKELDSFIDAKNARIKELEASLGRCREVIEKLTDVFGAIDVNYALKEKTDET
tara:strand:+ start:102 stop:332 length:231 start_codon:yes stop_codon:yes gene_type:complete